MMCLPSAREALAYSRALAILLWKYARLGNAGRPTGESCLGVHLGASSIRSPGAEQGSGGRVPSQLAAMLFIPFVHVC